jgi:hypothetical protein
LEVFSFDVRLRVQKVRANDAFSEKYTVALAARLARVAPLAIAN